MYPHPIRLRGNWKPESLTAAGSLPRCRYRRTFHRPSNLDPHERLWLVMEKMQASGIAYCNGNRLGEVGTELATAFEITQQLLPQNEVVIELEAVCLSQDPAFGEVRLEVRQPQFLDRWSIGFEHSAGQTWLHLTGRLAGEPCEETLEVVVRDLEAELLYSLVTVGADLDISVPTEVRAPGISELQIRIIRGGTRVWEARSLVEVPGEPSRGMC